MSELITSSKKWSARDMLLFLGTYIGPFGLALFGVALWYYGTSQNLFTFAAWGTMDLMIGFAMVHSGAKSEALLPIGYGIICMFVVAMIFRNGQWNWGTVEWLCLAGTVASMVCWYYFGAVYAVLASGAALAIASIPAIIGTYHAPQTWEWWLWASCNISAGTGLYISAPWKFKNISQWLFVAVSAVVNTLILILLLAPLFK